jgi:hypothetical protein
MQLGDKFEPIKVASEAIKRFVLDGGESFHVKNQRRSAFFLSVRNDVVSGFWHPNPV